MVTLEIKELEHRLDEFYREIEGNRDKFLGRKVAPEPRAWRNEMIQFVLRSLPERAVIADLFSGDAVVPMALLYLQKHYDDVNGIDHVYLVDNNREGCFDLLQTNANHFGVEDRATTVRDMAEKPGLIDTLDGVNAVTLIDSVVYYTHGGYISSKEDFESNLFAKDTCLITDVMSLSPELQSKMRAQYPGALFSESSLIRGCTVHSAFGKRKW
ncbi:hypothetical protein HN419_00645 [Candidatus Woesearchaeota archaeon]|jgi:hypothetical protein|nr:hypothetical protein [Candidatus Woesearchaeota archaeon]MBT3537495.1 hypothetical protein [Candidatus Woesearchaeota archaeon]MBT4697236.1 hypothetical protein [Candidatus Woesearchaeota archaeon]MBT4717620.1 hypothetical protein [Candidatus Woesearchaeota archaeon]MBT7106195.1 hypothetical protein [Candidatus Woesearchaeota archaeon]